MYSIRNFFKQTPNAVSAGAGTILTNIALAGWSPLTDKQSLAVVGITFVVLSLFYVAPLTSSNAKLQTLSDAQPDPVVNVTVSAPEGSAPALKKAGAAVARAIKAEAAPRKKKR